MKRNYPTDLTDAEWKHIEPFVPTPKCRGPQRIHNPREEILDAVFYVLRSGCPWRLVPREYPPWKTVYHYFREWRINGTFEKLNLLLRERLRICLGRRNPQPSAGIADSQSAKTTGGWVENREATTVERRFTVGKDTYWWTPRDWL
jgi:putative transposase